jgi:hypothetical protein
MSSSAPTPTPTPPPPVVTHIADRANVVDTKQEAPELLPTPPTPLDGKADPIRSPHIEQWLSTTTINDIVFDEVTKELISINGWDLKQLTLQALRRFCVKNKIPGYKNKRKEYTCALIVRRHHRDNDLVYPEVPPLQQQDDNDDLAAAAIAAITTDEVAAAAAATAQELANCNGAVVARATATTPAQANQKEKASTTAIATTQSRTNEKSTLMARERDALRKEKERDAIRKEKELLEVVVSYRKNVKDMRQELLDLKRAELYDSDSSVAKEAKRTLGIFKRKRDEAITALNANSLGKI